jgi:hypothetical protein
MSQSRPTNRTFWRSLALALGLFALLCGAILVFTPLPRPSQRQGQLGEGCIGEGQVRQALVDVGEAAHALEASDYGRTRQYLQNARVTLERTLEQEQDTATR